MAKDEVNKLSGQGKLPVTVYTPEPAILHPGKLLRDMFRDLINSRELALQLAIRDTAATYRQSYLGYLWAFLLPLVNTLTWLFLKKSGIVRLESTGIPYPVFVLTGTMLWQIFTESIQSPLQQITNAKAMLSKLNFPREALILSGIYKTMLNTAVKLVLLLPAILFLGVFPDEKILLFPLVLFGIIITGLAIGLFLAPWGMLYTDIGRVIPIFTQFFMFISPVVFMAPTGGLALKLFQWNFMTPLILNGRNLLTGMPMVQVEHLLLVIAGFFLLLIISWVVFRITMPLLVERMSS